MRAQFERKKKGNNKGFTIVELLIAIMIMAVISTAVFSFMTVGAQIFNRSNLEVEMQNEAQIMKNYMNDLICDTTRGLEFIKSTDAEANTYGADRCLIIYGEDCVAYLGWLKEEKEIRYLEKDKDSFTIDEEGVYHVTLEDRETVAANWPLMATYVTEFDCRLDDLKKEHRIFSAKLGFVLKQLSYDTTHTIALRNDIFYEGRSEVLYEEAMGSFKEQITRITLAPGSVDKAIDRENGTQVEFTATVLAIGNIDTSVIFEVEGNTSANTRMENNVLKIARDENSPVLTVICKSVVDENISTTAVVNIASVSAITIRAKQEPAYKNLYYFPKSTVEFEANVEGNFATSEGRNVTWELVGESGTAKIIETKGAEEGAASCKIYTGDQKGQVLKLKATSQVDRNITAEYEVYVADMEVGELYIAAKNSEYAVRRGSSLQLEVLKEGQKVQTGITWSIKDNPLGNKLNIDNNGTISASIDIPFERAYEFTVVAQVPDEDDLVKTVTSRIKIKAVDISFEPEYLVMAAKAGGNPYRVKLVIEGINVKNGELVVQQKPFVRKLEHWVASQNEAEAILGVNMSLPQDAVLTDDYRERTKLKVSLKGYSNVSKELPVYIYKYNIGIDQYAPVPGDGLDFIKDANNDGIPDTTETVVIGGVNYGYTKVSVNGVVYHYYVNTSKNPKWYVKIGNNAKKYVYDATSKVYSVLSN